MPSNTDQSQENCIFDLGLHHGFDTKFYLDKGFRVVALEANPSMIQKARQILVDPGYMDRLVIEDKALSDRDGEQISFFVNPVKDDWSSVSREWSEKGGHKATEIRVDTITTSKLFDLYGVPYYVKCDIEGADELFARQLLADKRRPKFVSVEAVSHDMLSLLFACGYDRVQIVNQAFHWTIEPPKPPREGTYVQTKFNGFMSGLFGLELDRAKWRTFAEAADLYLRFRHLRRQEPTLAHGWLDFHVTTQATLDELGSK